MTTAQVRVGAQVGRVNVCTVWRWLEAARTGGRMERRPRARLELSDQAWEALAQAGGNVAARYRHLKEAGGEVPSLASLHRVVRRDLQAGRVLPDRAVVRRERKEQQTRQALADLALAGLREAGAAKTSAPPPPRSVPEAIGGPRFSAGLSREHRTRHRRGALRSAEQLLSKVGLWLNSVIGNGELLGLACLFDHSA
ncbi:hypothetical protein ACFT38_41065 [Streptomyces sp. NPDC056975]|uniref:hypothetical protein n=1 Tax=Streptomyces sp. NPDC056975 TaxID=3345985 RepID=UPI003634B4D2